MNWVVILPTSSTAHTLKKLCIEQLEGSGLKKEWCFRAKLLYAALHTSFWYIQISFSIMLYVVS